MTPLARAFFLAVLLAAGAARAEDLTIALSSPEVRIDSNFTGATITIFGVIGRDAASASRPIGYEIATVALGPPETVVARRKDRILGIWANHASQTLLAVPSFYALNTSSDLGNAAPPAVLARLGLGFENIRLAHAGHGDADDPDAGEFRDAFIRLKSETGLYSEQIRGVSFVRSSVFRAAIRLPANVPVGAYTVTVYLFAGNAFLAEASEHFAVTKTGFESYMYSVARSRSFLYGLACVGFALLTGWLAGVIFRRD
jgi:uncharacterized protein (TIGR02186 family)